MYNSKEVLEIASKRAQLILDEINAVSTPQQAVKALDKEMRIMRCTSDVLKGILEIKSTIH